jgi:hypothetical protein
MKRVAVSTGDSKNTELCFGLLFDIEKTFYRLVLYYYHYDAAQAENKCLGHAILA